MSDENVIISVDDSAIDAAIAKLDEALDKTSQLTEQTSTGTDQFYTIPNSEMDQINKGGQVDTSEATAKLDDLEAKDTDVKANVDETVASGTTELTDLEAETVAAQTSVTEVAAESEGQDIPGLERSAARITRMIPGLREAYRLDRSMVWLEAGNIFGVVTLLLLAYSIYNEITAGLATQQQQQAEYQKTVMGLQGFVTAAQFTAWQNSQNQAIQSYRLGVLP